MNYELINYCEIFKPAIKAYSLIHNISNDLNLGDISKNKS
jgi:site-specific DNA-cytosine methylase